MYSCTVRPSGVPPLMFGAEDVAGRDRRDAETLGEPRGLGALAGTGRAEQDEPCRHRRNPS